MSATPAAPSAALGSMSTSESQLEAGTRLGDFTLLRLLGQGPLGDVFAARTAGGTPALVRVLARRVVARPPLRERIGQDLLLLRGVDHPAVARVLAIGEERERVFYGLEDPGALTVAELIQRGRPLDERELVWLGAGVSAGLAALHHVGLAHGSLSAHSVFMGRSGPVIVDLAWTVRLREPSAELSSIEPPAPSGPHDMRAFGLLLVQAATGSLPAEGGKRELPPGTSPRVNVLVDQLLGPPDKRPPADKVARLFAQMAREVGLGASGASGMASGIKPAVGAVPAPPGGLAPAVVGAPPASLEDLVARVNRGETAEVAAQDPTAGPNLGRFGRYVLMEEIGRGGMGVVYRARHADFERYFGLKVMLAGALADDTARRRFLHEAEAAAALDHPAVVRVHDCGVVDGRAYIAMDLTEGRPFTEVYKDESRPLEELLAVFLDVVRGVHYAHSRGIIHRDLKPENVIIDPKGQPHILDFGVAKRVGETSGLITVAGELVGTPAYMPPEQAEGRGNDIDTRSDVYALGASLFEVVTRGRLPFEGKTVTDTLTRILLEDPPSPSALRPGIPWEVDAIVLKALEKKRERRYQSAADLAEDLSRFLEGQPIRARQATFGYRARKWFARRWPYVAGVVTVASLGLGAAAVTVSKRRADVLRLTAEGDAALERGDTRLAIERYAHALALDEDDVRASVGRERANTQLEESERAARRLHEQQQVAAFLEKALEREAAGDLKGARQAFEQATAFEVAPEEARAGRRRVEEALAAQAKAATDESLAAADTDRAQRYEREAAAHQAKGELDLARASLLKALAFGSTTAAEGLARLEEQLLAARVAEVQEAVRRQGVDKARALVQEGQRALDRDELEPARRAFLQALGFDGTSQAAQEGLLEIDRLQRGRQSQLERAARLRQTAEQMRLARENHEKGRTLFRQGEDGDAVREAYFQSLDAYDKALFVVPDHEEARRERAAVALEVSVILRDEGQYELADFLLRGAGGQAAAPPELPQDPHLVVVEGDKVNIRRAFGGVVRFLPTRVFDRLREHVQARGRGRFRVEVQVRSEITASIPPAIHAKGLWVRVEDTVAHTLTPVVKIEFEGGPYLRQVTVDARGRIVAPFERSRDLPFARYVEQAETTARRLLTELEAKANR